jgi:sialate O-acetylesterase
MFKKGLLTRCYRLLPLCVVLMALFFFGFCPAQAYVKVAPVFSDHMVMQRDHADPVFGTGHPGEVVGVSLAGKHGAAITDKDGHWLVTLPPIEVGGPYEMTVTSAENLIKVHDIQVGEVWVYAGQSKIPETFQANLSSEDDSSLRICVVPEALAFKPTYNPNIHWFTKDLKQNGDISATAYLFGLELRKALKVPVGIIQCISPGSSVEAWVVRSSLENNSNWRGSLSGWDQIEAGYQAAIREYNKKLAAWEKAVIQAGQAGEIPPPKPEGPKNPDRSDRPASVYNGMMSSVVPFGVKGVVWNQGEGSITTPLQFKSALLTLIADWRTHWQSAIPILFVQLPRVSQTDAAAAQKGGQKTDEQATKEQKPEAQKADETKSDSQWAEIRENQFFITRTVPYTRMLVTIDLGNVEEVHEKQNAELAHRLANYALGFQYHLPGITSGPVLETTELNGNKFRLNFRYADQGLTVRSDSKGKKELKGFAVAGRDKEFVSAKAQIDGDSVTVWSDKVTRPVAVRYAWGDDPECNLCNAEGMPASPFRTDDWNPPPKSTGLDLPQ